MEIRVRDRDTAKWKLEKRTDQHYQGGEEKEGRRQTSGQLLFLSPGLQAYESFFP